MKFEADLVPAVELRHFTFSLSEHLEPSDFFRVCNFLIWVVFCEFCGIGKCIGFLYKLFGIRKVELKS